MFVPDELPQQVYKGVKELILRISKSPWSPTVAGDLLSPQPALALVDESGQPTRSQAPVGNLMIVIKISFGQCNTSDSGRESSNSCDVLIAAGPCNSSPNTIEVWHRPDS
jgi:hypothetical protein